MTCHETTPAYPDHAWHGRVAVLDNVEVARATYRIRLAAPELAKRILPGQFLMLRLAERDDPLLGRPLAMYDVVTDSLGNDQAVDVVYLVVGRMTGLLAQLPAGAELDVWGPLGNGFPIQPVEHLVMVAGGIGQTPLLSLGRESLGSRRYGTPPREAASAKRVTLCYGARAGDCLAGVADFEAAGIDVCVATEDGSRGHHGLVTDLIGPVVAESAGSCRIVTCGPEPMLAAVARLARELGVPCQVSLETPMACGIGACFSCVARIRDAAGDWDYRRTCIEGPVFDADRVVFQ
ncbi:MAG: dihydroorotate dehydrogenase electron transfer subunit [Patescibacteria group bacterium]|nr:dihydroorotate dehydrogenase electron transfer subunit [Patescibacteria group bacterium]